MAIDPRIIRLLDSTDVNTRKKAVKALAQSKDREALEYLADVYNFDDDAEVRELARKAGIYIKNNAPEATSMPQAAYDDRVEDGGAYMPAPYIDDDDDYDQDEDGTMVDNTPLPSEMRVSASDAKRARGYMDQAMDMNVRGDHAKATEALRRALKLDPRLMYDNYTRSLASTITGLDGQTALKRLGPDSADLQQKARKGGASGGVSASAEPLQAVFIGLLLICSGLVFIGYFFLPWVDIGGIEDPESGMTINEALDTVQSLSGIIGTDPETRAVFDALDKLNFSPNGFSTTRYRLGQSNILEYFGIISALESFADAAPGQNINSGQINDAISLGESQLGLSLSLEAEPIH